MSRITTVIDPANSLSITTVERAKMMLAIRAETTEHDDLLEMLIRQASARADSYCDRIFAQQKYRDDFRRINRSLILRYPPIGEISLFTFGGSAVTEGSAFSVDRKSGVIEFRRCDGLLYDSYQSGLYGNDRVVATVEYIGGFEPPPATGVGSLLRDAALVEDAVLRLVVSAYKGRARDPMMKASEKPQVGRQEFWVGSPPMSGGIPEEVAGILDGFVLGGAV